MATHEVTIDMDAPKAEQEAAMRESAERLVDSVLSHTEGEPKMTKTELKNHANALMRFYIPVATKIAQAVQGHLDEKKAEILLSMARAFKEAEADGKKPSFTLSFPIKIEPTGVTTGIRFLDSHKAEVFDEINPSQIDLFPEGKTD